jgi:hypothetical protein
MTRNLYFPLGILTFTTAVSAWAGASATGSHWAIESTASRVHLVELYSSEGCSSCPPAEAWLRTLRSNVGLWKNFVPVEFHIDYWNRLGWDDPFSETRFSDRQRDLARTWGKDSVYTPGFALDGAEWRPNSDSLPLPVSKVEVGVLRAERVGTDSYTIRFRAQGKPPTSLRVYGALLGNGFKTIVKSGENSGQTLSHEFVAIRFSESALRYDSKLGLWTATIELGGKGVTIPNSKSVVFWVTEVGKEKPIQAVGGDLS